MARTLDLNRLSSQPDAYRTADWEQAFFHALLESNIKVEGQEPKAGPDGWPYMFARTGPDATEPAVRLLDWLATRGIGLVINGHKDVPDYVFTYGMIWNLKERGQFLSPKAESTPTGAVELKAGQKVVAGIPTTEYLPKYVREILLQFLRNQGIESPKILMLSQDQKNFDLCFSLESLGSPPEHEHRGIAEALAWFLPGHYSLMLISENGLPPFTGLEIAESEVDP